MNLSAFSANWETPKIENSLIIDINEKIIERILFIFIESDWSSYTPNDYVIQSVSKYIKNEKSMFEFII